jgi:hypothetical protein
MIMEASKEKYKQTIEILKKSVPVADSQKDIEREVINRISSLPIQNMETSSIFNFLFGWTEIVWIRRSLIMASFVLVLVFIYQQSVIVKQLNLLSNRIVVNNERPVNMITSDFSGKLRFLMFSRSRVHSNNRTITDEQLEMLIESVDKLKKDYDNLNKIIMENPELKDLIEKKLNEKNLTKVIL